MCSNIIKYDSLWKQQRLLLLYVVNVILVYSLNVNDVFDRNFVWLGFGLKISIFTNIKNFAVHRIFCHQSYFISLMLVGDRLHILVCLGNVVRFTIQTYSDTTLHKNVMHVIIRYQFDYKGRLLEPTKITLINLLPT